MRYFEHAHTLIRHGWPPHVGRDGMRRFQARKLRSIVAHCRERVAVYRDHWRDADVASASIAAPEAVRALPVIGKDDLRSRPLRDTLADGADPTALVRHETSGSSGQPFAIYRSPFEEHLLQLFRMRALADAGRALTVATASRALHAKLPAPRTRRVMTARTWPGRLRRALGIHPDADLDGIALTRRRCSLVEEGSRATACRTSSLRLSVDAPIHLADEALARGATVAGPARRHERGRGARRLPQPIDYADAFRRLAGRRFYAAFTSST